LLRIISIYSGILPIIIFFLFLYRNKKGGLWVIFLYVFYSFLTDIAHEVFIIRPESSFFLLSLFTVLEYSFFTAFLYLNFKRSSFKLILIITSLIFYLFCIHSFFTTKDFSFDSLPASIEAILIIFFCILFFFEQINNPDVSFIYSSKKFWIATAFLIYLSGTLFLFIYTSNLSEAEQGFYWPINYVFNILKNLIITLAFSLPSDNSQSLTRKPYEDIFERPYKPYKP
jgi:hypothetical protein